MDKLRGGHGGDFTPGVEGSIRRNKVFGTSEKIKLKLISFSLSVHAEVDP
jgi:hypothetical protein